MAKYHVPVIEQFEWQQAVIDKDVLDPSTLTPSKGDRYLINGVGVGDWTGQDNNIAYYDGTAWQFIAAKEGMHVWVKDEDKVYVFDGTSWSTEGSGTGDMSKSVYDTNDNGIVDKAESLQDVNGTKLEIIDGTNPILKFIDKNGKVVSIQKTADTNGGDRKNWLLDIEGNQFEIFYDEGTGHFGVNSPFEVDGETLINGNFKIDVGTGNTFELNVDSNAVYFGAYGQGAYFELTSGGGVQFNIETAFSQNMILLNDNTINVGDPSNRLQNVYLAGTLSDGTNSATVAAIVDAINKAHTQNTDQYLDFGGPNQISAAQAKEAYDKRANYIAEYGALEFDNL